MKEAQDTTDRKLKWMRYSARALAVVWVVCWMVFVAVMAFLTRLNALHWFEDTAIPDWMYFPFAAGLVALAIVSVSAVPGWVGIGIARRWPAAGGSVLVAEGLLLLGPSLLSVVLHSPLALWPSDPFSSLAGDVLASSVLVPVGGLALVTGTLYLANWWKSRRSALEGWTWRDPRWVVAIPVVLGVALGLPLYHIIDVSLHIVPWLVFCTFNVCIF